MPKMKTHKGTKKRVKKTSKGKYKRAKAFTGHIKTKKSSKRKRDLRQGGLVSKADQKKIEKLLPYD